MNKKTLSGLKIITLNRKASFNYFFKELFEAGIVLRGSEIKSILEIIKPNISIDYNSLSHFLWKGYYVDGDTAYSEIKSLLPGETLKISRFQE